jgi:hypothetical protein
METIINGQYDTYDTIVERLRILCEKELANSSLPSALKTMIDIETLDTHPSNSVIFSIGIVVFGIGDKIATSEDQLVTYQTYLPIQVQIYNGRTISQDTLLFHLKNSFALNKWKDAMLDEPKGRSLYQSLVMTKNLIMQSDEIWVNGMNFDATNISTLLFSIFGIQIKHNIWRDYRTIAREFNVDYRQFFVEGENHHCALDDALAQTRALLFIKSKYINAWK